MGAVVCVLNESLTESIRGFYKIRKAFMALDALLHAENKYMKGQSRNSIEGRKSIDSLRSNTSKQSINGTSAGLGNNSTGAKKQEKPLLNVVRQKELATAAQSRASPKSQETSDGSKEDSDDDEEFYDVVESQEDIPKTETYAGHIEINGVTQDLAKQSLDFDSRSGIQDLPQMAISSDHQILDHDPDSEIFSNPIDVFVHSGANLWFGLLLVMISMIPPAFNKLLFIIGFHGDRDRGLLLLWQASKFHNINGAMAGLVLLGYYHGVVGFADILPEPVSLKGPEAALSQQNVRGYPKERCEELLQDMRARHPKSQLWLLEEARMEAMNCHLSSALSILKTSSKTKSPLKQVEALNMFEMSLNAMYIHDYSLCAESFLKCIKMNNWSHALYYYIAGAAHVEMYRRDKLSIRSSEKKAALQKHAEKATEYFRLSTKHAGKKKFMARQLPFDVFVTRKVQKWETRAKEWNVAFIDAVGVSPLDEMIFFWNGYKRMNKEEMQTSLENLAWSDTRKENETWVKEEKDEKAVLAVLRAATLRALGRWDDAVKCLQDGVLDIDRAELKGGLRDDWTAPSAHYERGAVCWMRRKEGGGKSEMEWVKECESWVEKAAKWESYELDARIGLKVATAQDTLKKYWEGTRR
ncbi:MAG: hypothetical protein Q9222_004571 [Ikaeria aurantiellina]